MKRKSVMYYNKKVALYRAEVVQVISHVTKCQKMCKKKDLNDQLCLITIFPKYEVHVNTSGRNVSTSCVYVRAS